MCGFNRPHNHCCRGRAKSVTYSERVSVALLIKNAMRMRRIILSSAASLALLNFSTLFRKRHDFRKKFLNIKYFDFLYNFRLKHFSYLEEFSDIL